MSADEYQKLHELLGKAIEESTSEKTTDETAWYVLMAAQRIAFARMFALRYESPVPVPQSLRA